MEGKGRLYHLMSVRIRVKNDYVWEMFADLCWVPTADDKLIVCECNHTGLGPVYEAWDNECRPSIFYEVKDLDRVFGLTPTYDKEFITADTAAMIDFAIFHWGDMVKLVVNKAEATDLVWGSKRVIAVIFATTYNVYVISFTMQGYLNIYPIVIVSLSKQLSLWIDDGASLISHDIGILCHSEHQLIILLFPYAYREQVIFNL